MKALEPGVPLHTGSIVGQLWRATLPGTLVSKLCFVSSGDVVCWVQRKICKKDTGNGHVHLYGSALSQHPSLAAELARRSPRKINEHKFIF